MLQACIDVPKGGSLSWHRQSKALRFALLSLTMTKASLLKDHRTVATLSRVEAAALSPTAFEALQTDHQFHPHHLTDNSPWPILTANSVLSMLVGAVLYFNTVEYGGSLLGLGTLATVSAMYLWFKDVTTEGTFLGRHTRIVQQGLSMGVSLFIVTETLFFMSIFWASASWAPLCRSTLWTVHNLYQHGTVPRAV